MKTIGFILISNNNKKGAFLPPSHPDLNTQH